ncbi:MAG: DUF354 domain-containing protein [Nitrososphaerales archaeon]
MKIWIDILTPKQAFFASKLSQTLMKDHEVWMTSRNYPQVIQMGKILGIDLEIIGKHGGSTNETKLSASIDRLHGLQTRVNDVKPDVCISFLSPEAARISFGLKVPHLAESDSPHASHVCKLVVPLLDSLYTPYSISLESWLQYGIKKEKIHRFRGLDPMVWLRDYKPNSDILKKLGLTERDRIVTIRTEEEQAAYVDRSTVSSIYPITKKLAGKFPDHKFVILARYTNRMKIEREDNILNVEGIIDGPSLLHYSKLFIGGGGTMTQEAALMGIPSIGAHRSSIPEVFSGYLIPEGLVKWRTKPAEIEREAEAMPSITNKVRSAQKKKVARLISVMEDPIPEIAKAVQTMRVAHN